MNERKVGRPKIENPKSESIRIRLTKDELNRFEKFAEKKNITKSELIRRSVYAYCKGGI